MSVPSRTKKPSYFKTLPDEIVKSPTGVTKIPNSRFPTIAPINPTTYKSVYERAGFEVYKPKGSSSKRSSRSSGSRSVSASHLSSQPSSPTLMQKQNKSDAAFVLKNRSVTGPVGNLTTSNVKPGLSIDAKLANSTFHKSPSTAQSTPSHSTTTVPSTTTSTISSKSMPSEHSASASAISRSFDAGGVTSGSVPENAYADALSRSQMNLGSTASLHTQNSQTQISPREPQLNPYITARSHEHQPTSTLDHSDESAIRRIDISNMSLEKSLVGDTLDVSDDELNLSSDDGFDDQSMRSNVLSPMPQAQLSPSNSLVESPVKLQTSSSPHIPQHAVGIPTFTVSPPMDNMELSPPKDYITRASGVSIAASSIYSNEVIPKNHESFVPPLPDLRTHFNTIQDQADPMNDSYNRHVLSEEQEQPSDMTVSAFEDVEKELEDLGMNSASSRNLQNSLDFIDGDRNKSQRDPQLQMDATDDSAIATSVEILPLSKSHAQNVDSFDFAPTEESTVHEEERSLERPQLRSTLPEDERRSDFSQSMHGNEEPQSQIRHPPGKGPCRKCSLPVTKKPIYSKSGELSGQWHRDCFTCTLCEIRFNKTIPCFVLNDLPYCEFHYHVTNHSLCQVCGKGIVGECLENDTGDRYHIDCFKCTQCDRKIDEDYMSIDEKVYCEQCAADFATINTTRSTKIERRRTRLFFI